MYVGRYLKNTTTNFEIEKPIAGLVLYMLITSAALAAATDTDDMLTAIADFIDDAKFSLAYQSKDGNRTVIMQARDMIMLLENETLREGSIVMIPTGTVNQYSVRCSVSLTGIGSLPFDNDEKLEGTLVLANSEIDEISIYTLESPVLSPQFDLYEQLTVDTNEVDKVFKVGKYNKLMIPVSSWTTALTLDLTYTNGRKVRIDKEMMYAFGNRINDAVYNVNGAIVAGFGNYVILDVSGVVEIQMLRTATTAFVMNVVRSVPVGNLLEVANSNANLVDTTEGEKLAAATKQGI